ELPDVARPGVAVDETDEVGVQVANGAAVERRRCADEVSGQQKDVTFALAERWHVEREHEQAVVEVEAERAAGDGALEVHRRGCQYPGIHHERLLGAQPTDLTMIHGCKQLGLKRQRQLARSEERRVGKESRSRRSACD